MVLCRLLGSEPLHQFSKLEVERYLTPLGAIQLLAKGIFFRVLLYCTSVRRVTNCGALLFFFFFFAEMAYRARARICTHEGCEKYAVFGLPGTKSVVCCKRHATAEMVNITHKKCAHDGCGKCPSFATEGSKVGVYCKQHADPGMVNVVQKRCAQESCTMRANFGLEGSRAGIYCKRHAVDGMVDIAHKRCAQEGCGIRANFGKQGTRVGVYCKQHAESGMVHVGYKRCASEGCKKWPSFGQEGGKMRIYCETHAEEGMTGASRRGRCSQKGCLRRPCHDSKPPSFCKLHMPPTPVKSRRRGGGQEKTCAHEGCSKIPVYAEKGTKRGVYCRAHAKDDMVKVTARRCGMESCDTPATFGEAGKIAAYCRWHAKPGMMNVKRKPCGEAGCSRAGYFEADDRESGVLFCMRHAQLASAQGRASDVGDQSDAGGSMVWEGEKLDQHAEDMRTGVGRLPNAADHGLDAQSAPSIKIEIPNQQSTEENPMNAMDQARDVFSRSNQRLSSGLVSADSAPWCVEDASALSNTAAPSCSGASCADAQYGGGVARWGMEDEEPLLCADPLLGDDGVDLKREESYEGMSGRKRPLSLPQDISAVDGEDGESVKMTRTEMPGRSLTPKIEETPAAIAHSQSAGTAQSVHVKLETMTPA